MIAALQLEGHAELRCLQASRAVRGYFGRSLADRSAGR
ncbi:hypothetical protein RSPO_m00457 (plasmid) [Ralstonia solanacearum Po82]|uniref:Uncharacterized protein n=1 Tax=Ralstonia solanacearum (strain Po82) TaxID=1031711 RepID=F6G8K6_RALS8|nr:hypothetical protein RSPO_m00457 [Ralstonia solanacearum Po82]